MRDPSIHITESRLGQILTDLGFDKPNKLAKRIVSKAKIYPVNNRKLMVNNNKTEKKVNRVMVSKNSDAELFSLILLHTRRKLKHRGITQIKQNSRDWLTIKEIVVMANEFCETFKLDKKIGYVKFIEIGVSKMAKFMLVKFLNMGGAIIETYASILELEGDDKTLETEKLHNYYQSQILSKTGIITDYTKNPDKYVYFYRARVLANKLGVDAITYIKAQFYALEWRNGYPDPIQLVGDKAINYLNKYLFENKISVNKKEIQRGRIDFSKIKELGGEDD